MSLFSKLLRSAVYRELGVIDTLDDCIERDEQEPDSLLEEKAPPDGSIT